jgi:hypothetical protein
MDEKRFRFDLLIALSALIISAVAAGASAYQTYVIRQQYSATVWPYLTFITSSSPDKFVEVDVSNAGIGPALIRSATVTRDGRPIRSVATMTSRPALSIAIDPERIAANADEARTRQRSNLTISSVNRGDVIPAGSKLQLLRADGTFLARRLLADAGRIDVQICYCSLLGTCWVKRLWDPSVEPHAVAACPDA